MLCCFVNFIQCCYFALIITTVYTLLRSSVPHYMHGLILIHSHMHMLLITCYYKSAIIALLLDFSYLSLVVFSTSCACVLERAKRENKQ